MIVDDTVGFGAHCSLKPRDRCRVIDSAGVLGSFSVRAKSRAGFVSLSAEVTPCSLVTCCLVDAVEVCVFSCRVAVVLYIV